MDKEKKGDQLSKREREIFTFVGQGKTSAEIAKATGLSQKTIQTYYGRICAKLGLRNARQLMRAAFIASEPQKARSIAAVSDRADSLELRFLDRHGKVIHSRKYRAV